MNTNFTFLTEMFPELEKTGSLAEGYLYSDPNTCLFKLGTFAEIMVNYMFDLDNLAPPETDNTHANRLRMLWQAGYLPQDINDIFYVLRKSEMMPCIWVTIHWRNVKPCCNWRIRFRFGLCRYMGIIVTSLPR